MRPLEFSLEKYLAPAVADDRAQLPKAVACLASVVDLGYISFNYGGQVEANSLSRLDR